MKGLNQPDRSVRSIGAATFQATGDILNDRETCQVSGVRVSWKALHFRVKWQDFLH